jgi:hypothetical protein
MVAVRRPHQHADHGSAGKERVDLYAVAHDVGVLADTLLLSHWTQSSSERLRHHRRIRRGVPRLRRPHSARERDHSDRAAERRMEHLLGRQEPQRSGGRLRHRRQPEALAARSRLRPLLPVHWRRDQPVVSRADRGQPLRTSSSSRPGPKTGITSRGTSPTRPSASYAIPSNRGRTSRGTSGTVPAPITRRITHRRSSSRSTRASSTTATRPIANGCSTA